MKKLGVCLLTAVLLMGSAFPESKAFAASDNLITEDGITKVPMKESTSEINFDMLSQDELSKAKELTADNNSNEKGLRNTVNDAITVQTDTVYGATIPSDNSVWIKVDTANKKKLTMVLQFDNNADFITNIYELTDSTTLTLVEQSENFTYKTDATSFIPNGGWYYIQIAHLSGDRNVSFLLENSNSFSAKEPNDNIHQAATYNDYINVIDTFDSYRDQDWSILNVTSPGAYFVAVMFREVYQGPVLVEIIELETGTSYSAHENTPIFGVYANLPRTGRYAVRVTSDKEINPTNEYVLTVAKEDAVIAPTSVSLETVHNENNHAITSDMGYYIVQGTTIQVSGHLKRGGSILANVPVIACLKGTGQNNIKTRAGITGSKGQYKLDPNLPARVGINYWPEGQYYDVNSMEFLDFAGNRIGNNSWTLYNFK